MATMRAFGVRPWASAAASEAIRRTFFCYAYNAKQSRQGAMGLCNVGNAAN